MDGDSAIIKQSRVSPKSGIWVKKKINCWSPDRGGARGRKQQLAAQAGLVKYTRFRKQSQKTFVSVVPSTTTDWTRKFTARTPGGIVQCKSPLRPCVRRNSWNGLGLYSQHSPESCLWAYDGKKEKWPQLTGQQTDNQIKSSWIGRRGTSLTVTCVRASHGTCLDNINTHTHTHPYAMSF